MERLEPAALDEVLAGLLRIEPPARVMAIAENGLFVAMPSSVPLRGHVVIERATSALDLVIPADIVQVIEVWETAKAQGSASGKVHPAVVPDLLVELYFVDARHSHGVYLGFLSGVPVGVVKETSAQDLLRPRYGVMHKNDLAVITHADDAIVRILGWERDDLIGRRSLEIIHPDDHQRAIANWVDLISRPGAARRVRLRHQRADDSWVWLEVTNHNLLNDPDHGYVLGESVDITEEMAATEALRAGEELLRRLTDALPVGVIQLDADGVLVYRNDRARDILGHDVEPGIDMLAAVGAGTLPVGVLEQALNGLLADGDDREHEVEFDHPRGSARRATVGLRALRGADGSISGAIACLNDVTEAARLREELARRATYDALTGCYARRALLERLDALLAEGRLVTALFIDLDGFKPINDRHGHAVGDALLRHVGRCLTEHVGDTGLVGRLGGDEFLIASTGPRTDADAAAAADAVAEVIGTPLELAGGLRLIARASVGVARSPQFVDADALIAAADALMYQAKTERRTTPRD
jgi:diguanylate cyclase (GGDEF)-like protein/PAS domain S-box-containing protein